MNGFANTPVFLLFFCLAMGLLGLQASCAGEEPGTTVIDSKPDWRPLDGSWAICRFGGEGAVELGQNRIKIACGQPLSGIFWDQSRRTKNDGCKDPMRKPNLIRDGYEIKLQAKRASGFDFFCGLTFPIGNQHATLVLGGWGGRITGLSNVDGLDASENETTLFRDFEDDRWYRVRVRVDPGQVRCWVDDDLVAEVSRREHKFSLRSEMDLCEPLGIAAYECDVEYKDIMVRKLSAAELGTESKEKANR